MARKRGRPPKKGPEAMDLAATSDEAATSGKGATSGDAATAEKTADALNDTVAIGETAATTAVSTLEDAGVPEEGVTVSEAPVMARKRGRPPKKSAAPNSAFIRGRGRPPKDSLADAGRAAVGDSKEEGTAASGRGEAEDAGVSGGEEEEIELRKILEEQGRLAKELEKLVRAREEREGRRMRKGVEYAGATVAPGIEVLDPGGDAVEEEEEEEEEAATADTEIPGNVESKGKSKTKARRPREGNSGGNFVVKCVVKECLVRFAHGEERLGRKAFMRHLRRYKDIVERKEAKGIEVTVLKRHHCEERLAELKKFRASTPAKKKFPQENVMVYVSPLLRPSLPDPQ
ncbi:hypothetical protein DFP73DRAFT_600609 [Morchella snyderi]|nr:hypothetical protein DFP73DRAFT_600609 [Morchella snyderi]